MSLELLLTLVATLLLLLLSVFESAYDMLSEVSLRVVASEQEGKRHGAFLARLVGEPNRFTLALGFGRQLCVVSIAIMITDIAWATGSRVRVVLAFVASLAVIVVFREVLPRLIVQSRPQAVLVGLLPAASMYARLTDPILSPVYRAFERRRQREEAAQPPREGDEDQSDEIQALIDVAEEEGIIEAAEGEMIEKIAGLGDRVLSEVMTPRTRIVSIPASASIAEARDVMIESHFSRLPLYRESPDNIVGIVYVRDLLKNWRSGDLNAKVIEAKREVYFVPETKTISDQLQEMQRSKMHIAIVIDEYGAVAGLITIEDLLEEIVGEIEDEDRTAAGAGQEEIVPASDGSFRISGSAEIRKVELHFGCELAADDFTTVAGLVIKELGHMPKPGEALSFKDLEIRVESADSRRIETLTIRRIQPGDARAEPSEGHAEEESAQRSQS